MKVLHRALLAASALLVTSCGDDGIASKAIDRVVTAGERSGEQTASSSEVDAPFGFVRTSVRETSSQPTLCLHFNAPLDPAADYEPFVRIDRSVALTVAGQQICVEGLDYGDEARLTLLKGLPSADGASLQANEDVVLTFTDRPPVVQFAGNGIILPREDARGLGIQTVNVDEVSVRITRVTDRALVFRSLTSGYSSPQGRYTWASSDETPGQLSDPVFEGSLVTSGERNALTTTLLPLPESFGELESGAYYVELADASAEERDERRPAQAGRWIVITDLALSAYRGADGLDVVVRSLDTARAVGRVDVQLLAQSNEVLHTERSDGNGRARFDAPLLAGQDGNRPKLIIAEGPGGDFAFLDLDRAPVDLSAHPVGGSAGRDGPSAFAYLDRGIYRPGETVKFSALLRDERGFAAADQPGSITLFRPNGTEFLKERFTAFGPAGSLQRDLILPKDASRGQWRVAVALDGPGNVGGLSFAVEDFVPQRMALSLNADTETPLGQGQVRTVEATLRFLYGAPGAGLTVDGTARIEADPRPFANVDGYTFGLVSRPFSEELIDLKAVTTDGEGVAELRIDPGRRAIGATRPLRLRTVIRGEEPGGRAIREQLFIPYRPQDLYLGLKPTFEGSAERDAPVFFDLVALDREGAATRQDVRWRLIRTDYDYDWYRTNRGNWEWRRSERIVRIAEGLAETDGDGAAKLELPSLPWGDYTLIAGEGGIDRTSRSFWVGYGGRSADGTPAPDSVRVLVPDEAAVIGGEISVAIQAPYAGRAEVAVANASVLSMKQVRVPEGGTEVTLPVTEDWGAGAYVLVTVYTEREPGVRPVPRRAVGASYIPIDVSGRKLEATIDVPDVARPRGPVTVTIDGGPKASGREVYGTLAAVDEGILLLTKFRSPDPVASIFGKARLGVDLYDDYGRLLDPDTGEMGELRSGGDSIGGAGLTVVPTKTVALFEGPIRFGPDGEADVSLDLPDFNGELRLMAVLWSEEAVGSAAAPLTVRDPVPAELILPRFLAPGDEAVATVTIDNVEGAAGAYDLRVTSNSEAGLAVAEGEVSVVLEPSQRADRPVVLTASRPGVAGLTLNASGPDGFSVTRDTPIEVRGAFLPVTRIVREAVPAGGAFSVPASAVEGFVPGSVEVLISASPSPVDRSILETSLLAYPYGCTEQLVSRATPLLLAPSRSPDENGRLRRIVETLLERQGTDGSFGLWRVGDRLASPWVGAYATDFLARAKEEGMPVPDAAMDSAFRALQPVSQGEMYRAYGYDTRVAPARYTDDTQELLQQRAGAYALYVLARAGKVDRARLRYVHDAQLGNVRSPLARAQIGAALAAIGDRGRTENSFNGVFNAPAYRNPGDWYQTVLRDRAGIVAMAAEAGYEEAAAQSLAVLAKDVPDANRLTGQEKAYLIRAIDALSDGRDEAFLTMDGSRGSLFVLSEDDATMELGNPDGATVYAAAIVTGSPSSPPADMAEGLSVRKMLLGTDGLEVDTADIQQGDRMVVSITLTPDDEREAQLVLTDLLPAGFEIETVLQAQDSGPQSRFPFLDRLSRADIAEARDDRFVASIIKRGDQPLHFAYHVRAVTAGDFAFPGAVAEDMYRPDVYGRSSSARVTVAP